MTNGEPPRMACTPVENLIPAAQRQAHPGEHCQALKNDQDAHRELAGRRGESEQQVINKIRGYNQISIECL